MIEPSFIYRFATEALGLIYNLVRGFLLAHFAASFARPRFFSRGLTKCALAAVYGGVYLLMDLWDVSRRGGAVFFAKQALWALVACALLFVFFRFDRRFLALVVAWFASVADGCAVLSSEILHLLSLSFHLYAGWYETGALGENAYLRLIEWSAAIFTGAFYAIAALLTAVLLRLIARGYPEKETPPHRDELAFLMTPAVAGWLIAISLRMIMLSFMDAFSDGVYETLYDRQPIMYALVPVSTGLILASIVLDTRAYQKMREAARQRSERLLMEQQVLALQAQIEETRRGDEKTRALRHDMKNHVAVMRALSEKEDLAALETYLMQLSGEVDRTERAFSTGNAVADATLTIKARALERRAPRAALNADALLFPSAFFVEGCDLGVILSNALDNAIEACARVKGEAPEIRLQTYRKGKMFLIEVVNPFDEPLQRNAGEAFPRTDKEDADAHGFGMKNIARVAEKYRGGVDWRAKDGLFYLTAMLQEP